MLPWLKCVSYWVSRRTSTELEQQEKNFKSSVQIIVDSSNKRIDDLSKQVYDFKVSDESKRM